jgi:hypothetical protein
MFVQVVYSNVYMLDDGTTWKELPPMPKPDSHIEFAWVNVNNSLVIAGGTTDKHPITKKMVLVGEVFRFNLDTLVRILFPLFLCFLFLVKTVQKRMGNWRKKSMLVADLFLVSCRWIFMLLLIASDGVATVFCCVFNTKATNLVKLSIAEIYISMMLKKYIIWWVTGSMIRS